MVLMNVLQLLCNWSAISNQYMAIQCNTIACIHYITTPRVSVVCILKQMLDKKNAHTKTNTGRMTA